MIRKVEKGDLFSRSPTHGLIGFGLPDLHGDYENNFLRMVQEELDLSYPTLLISFLKKSTV